MDITKLNNFTCVIGLNEENSLEYHMCKNKINQILENDLKSYNPTDILDSYVDYFKNKMLKYKIINVNEEFYRGRIGKMIFDGAIDTYNTQFTVPFHDEEIEAAPPIYTSGGRFNRAGVSYLYLATDIETCLAEVHLQVGQECSIAKFKCTNNVKLINLSDFEHDLELKIWYEILTQPVHESIRHKYLITQFLSEVFLKLGAEGLYFKSVQSNGYNIVSFKPINFELIKFSEKIYEANKINYEFKQIEDSIRKFAKKNEDHLINDLNTDKVEENEAMVERLLEWIKIERTLDS